MEEGINYYERKTQREKALKAKELRPNTGKAIKLNKGVSGDQIVGKPQYKNKNQIVDTKQAMEMYKQGQTISEIARHFKVQPQSISYHITKMKKLDKI